MPFQINIVAVLVSVVVNFVLGFLWYTPIFGKIWAREMGYDVNMKPDSKVMVKGIVLMVVGNFLFAWVLASNLAGWQFIPGVKEMGPFANALNSAIFLWLGFYLPSHLSSMAWEQKSLKLFAINSGYHLTSLIVVSLILSYWR